MEDLLNEDEFLAPKPEAAPWRYLAVFCLIAIAQEAIIAVIYAYYVAYFNEVFLFLISFGLPPITVFIMFFGRKKNRFLSKKNLAAFILILLGTYFAPIVAIGLWAGAGALSAVFVFLCIFTGYFIVCFLILLSIVSEKQKPMTKL